MEKKLKENIAVYVDKIGVGMATKVAERLTGVEAISDQQIGLVKFHLAVMEYLYCDEEIVLECCLKESKI